MNKLIYEFVRVEEWTKKETGAGATCFVDPFDLECLRKRN